MSVVAAMCSFSVVLAVLLFGAFLRLTRQPKCPHCGGKEWVPLPHLGRYAAYCRKCTLEVDMANWKGKA